ncbi:MAG: PSD1 and planctomycete cytochrome C domain-containing protein [Planctomycetota bacterium]
MKYVAPLARGFAAIALAIVLQSTRSSADSNTRFFESKVRPLLVEHCFECHGPEEESGGLRLDSLAAMVSGGDSGPAIIPGDSHKSLFMKAVRYEGYEMPPTQRLPQDAIEVLRQWVDAGAPWPGVDLKQIRPIQKQREFSLEDRQWWAIQPIKKPSVPEVGGSLGQWAQTELDHFIARRLADNELAPAPRASKTTLIRRLYFNLVGLPPSPAEIQEFLDDTSKDSYEKLVDRLLDDRRYGERWARHWLDLVRYADSDGYRADAIRPNAWRYRDYVIDSFNQDKPYDRFMAEQIAGDEMFPEDSQSLIATGYLQHGIYEWNSRDAVGQRDILISEMTDVTGDVFLGLGMQCAKCHDHKFDPILQEDYFALRAFFEPVRLHTDADIATPEQKAKHEVALKPWQKATKNIREKLDALQAKYREKSRSTAIERFPESIQLMAYKPSEERTSVEQQLVDLVQRQVDYDYNRLETSMNSEDARSYKSLKKKLEKFDSLKPTGLPTARVVRDIGIDAPPTIIPKKQIDVVPGFLKILDSRTPNITAGDETTGRRTALAKWLGQPENPLSTRVIVNRIWQFHFGTGLASSASDFGRLGEAPSHPELLDWLVGKFVEDGWRLKPLHRRIVLSSTYQQSSKHADAARHHQVDPTNRLRWHWSTNRLDAEQIRDALLVVSGKLRKATGGPGQSATTSSRRSIYTLVRRNTRDPLLEVFDLPRFFTSTAKRDQTTSPLQSLLLINSSQMLSFATALAERVCSETNGSPTPDVRIVNLWTRVFGRPPNEDEIASALGFIHQQSQRMGDNLPDSMEHEAWIDLCHVLLNSNEFLYVH